MTRFSSVLRLCFFLWIIGPLFWHGCGSDSQSASQRSMTQREVEAQFERANQLSASRSQMQIEGYVRRMQLDSLTVDGFGIHYRVWGNPLGPHPREQVRVAIAYSAELLNGDYCHGADSIAPLEFTLGGRDQPAGLETLIMRIAPGQQALGIVPAHLAYGLAGDGENVPSNACLVYRIFWLRYPEQY